MFFPARARLSSFSLRVACALTVLVLGCDGAERRDAETVVIAVTRFRTADNNATPGAVEALRATPCNALDVCKTRELCLIAGDATSKALRLKAEVERGVNQIETGALAKDSPEAKALPQKLDDAEKLLKQGHDGLTACDEQVQALKRKHRI